MLYFDQIEHDRFGTVRQQIWAMLHYPLHVAIVLTVEGSTQFISFWIAAENLGHLDDRLFFVKQNFSHNTTLFVNGLQVTLNDFDARLKKAFIPDYSYNLTQIQSLDLAIPGDYEEALTIVDDIYNSLYSWIFKIFGFKLSEGLTKNAKDNFSKADAVYQAFNTVFVFFLISAGCVLIILGIMYWFGKNHKSHVEIASVFVRLFAGIGLALVSTSYYTAAKGNLISSPMMIPLGVIVYLLG